MTKNDYKLLALLIRDIMPDRASKQRMAHLLAIVLAAENERFDKEIFMKECGFSGKEKASQ